MRLLSVISIILAMGIFTACGGGSGSSSGGGSSSDGETPGTTSPKEDNDVSGIQIKNPEIKSPSDVDSTDIVEINPDPNRDFTAKWDPALGDNASFTYTYNLTLSTTRNPEDGESKKILGVNCNVGIETGCDKDSGSQLCTYNGTDHSVACKNSDTGESRTTYDIPSDITGEVYAIQEICTMVTDLTNEENPVQNKCSQASNKINLL